MPEEFDDVPEDFERWLVVHAVADTAWLSREDDLDTKIQVVAVALWAVPEGSIDANDTKKFVFVIDSLQAADLVADLDKAVVHTPTIQEQTSAAS